MSSPRPVRHREFVVPGYYDGYLLKQETKSQKYKTYWTVLRGNELFFQMTSRDPTYIEKISLDDFVSVEDDESHNDLQYSFILKLKSGNTKIKAESAEIREQWKGFIHTVAKLELPELVLLPGQIHRLQMVLEEEAKRRQKATSTPPPLPPPRPTTPELDLNNYDDVENNRLSCFYKVSRVEAEALLEKNAVFGNMLMRPSSNDQNLSVTTRQAFKNNAMVKHYKIRCADNGYVIEIDDGVLCNSRQEVINFFIQNTKGLLKPLEIPMDYEINLSFVQEDAESGELIHQKHHTTTRTPIRLTQPGIPKKPLPEHPKIQPQTTPSHANTLPALRCAINKELNTKLLQRRAAMYD